MINCIYQARAKSAKITNTLDGVQFVEVNLEVYPFVNNYISSYTLHWRSPLTKGGIKKTFLSLVQMGASMKLNSEDGVDNPLEGVGSKVFNVEIVNIECDENEAPGKYRTYAKVVI